MLKSSFRSKFRFILLQFILVWFVLFCWFGHFVKQDDIPILLLTLVTVILFPSHKHAFSCYLLSYFVDSSVAYHHHHLHRVFFFSTFFPVSVVFIYLFYVSFFFFSALSLSFGAKAFFTHFSHLLLNSYFRYNPSKSIFYLFSHFQRKTEFRVEAKWKQEQDQGM